MSISKRSVTISQRPLGVKFAHTDDKAVIVHTIKHNSFGEQLGLKRGDTLISVNGDSVINMKSELALHLFRKQSLPFHAAFCQQICIHGESIHDPENTELPNDTNENRVVFDMKKLGTIWNHTNKYLVSSNGFNTGKHEWTILVTKCDALRQEVGIISNLDEMNISDYGLCDTAELGSRAVFGNDLKSKGYYYASYNKDNTIRCHKDLSSGWNCGDQIKICLDLNVWNIKFLINGKKVRKTLSIQQNKTYYPIISFFGDCGYKIIDYK